MISIQIAGFHHEVVHGCLTRVSMGSQCAVDTSGDIADLVQHIEVYLPLLLLRVCHPSSQFATSHAYQSYLSI